ncbi:hypothetical protein WJX77_000826 [Trebouxia sp. C0004]
MPLYTVNTGGRQHVALETALLPSKSSNPANGSQAKRPERSHWDTDETASLYFLAPVLEQWVGTLKELLEPTGRTQLACDFTSCLGGQASKGFQTIRYLSRSMMGCKPGSK